MKTTIHSATLVGKGLPYDGQTCHVTVDNGTITRISESTNPDDGQPLDGKGMMLSIGWFDMHATFGDPGFESREDLDSGAATATAGGFTEVALLPNTQPVVQTKNELAYIKGGNAQRLSQLHPMGAVTLDTQGEALSEMIDLHHAGAVAFTDGKAPIWHTDILIKALQYLQKFDGLLINRPEDMNLTRFGTMNEGMHSTLLGMKGIPKLAEELMVARDLRLLEYAGGKIHFANISTAKAVGMIRDAKSRGLKVTCDMAAFQPLFEDEALHSFDAMLKVNPPFREKEDNDALLEGLKDGTIDVVVSGHTPLEEEQKKLEFDLADFGATGLQTTGANLVSLGQHVGLEALIEKVTTAPRRVLGLPIPELAEGAPANLTLFDPNQAWVFDQQSNVSKSVNSPFFGQSLVGKTVAVFNNGKVWLNK